jgi:hypothetical protein
MRYKTITSVKDISQNQVKTRFKALFWPTISYYTAICILAVFSIEIFSPILTAVTKNVVYYWIATFLNISIMPLIATWLVWKLLDITITPAGIFGHNLRCQRRYIGWNEITVVKPYQIFGFRAISIRVNRKQDIQLTSYFYCAPKMASLIRQYVGEDHPLVHALEKEMSYANYSPDGFLWKIIGSIGLILSIWLIGGNLIAAELEKPMEQAIANYVRQHPDQSPNQSAIDLQSLITKMGMSFVETSTIDKINKLSKKDAESRKIVLIIDKFLERKSNQTENSVRKDTIEFAELLPSELSNYLETHQSDIEAINSLLMNNLLPQLGEDSSWLKKGGMVSSQISSPEKISYTGLTRIQGLLIVNIIDKYKSSNVDISRDLFSIHQIQKAFQNQSGILGQLCAVIGSSKMAVLLRSIDQIPLEWGEKMSDHHRYIKIMTALEKDSMVVSRELQNLEVFDYPRKNDNQILNRILKHHYLIRPYLRFTAVKGYNDIQQDLSYWKQQNICRVKEYNKTYEYTKTFISPLSLGFNDDFFPIYNISKDYTIVPVLDLKWEFTNSIRQVKAQIKQHQNIDQIARDFKLNSQACPGEHWTARAQGNTITISLSHPPDWLRLAMKKHPTTYKIREIQRK